MKRPLWAVQVLTGLFPDRCGSSSTECWQSQQGQTRHLPRPDGLCVLGRQITAPLSFGGETPDGLILWLGFCVLLESLFKPLLKY